MKLRDFQLATYLLVHELGFSHDQCTSFLDTDIEVYPGGEKDEIQKRGKSVIVHNPTSVVKTLYNILYQVVFANNPDDYLRDVFSLSLLKVCHDYVYEDEASENITGPSVAASIEKFPIPHSIVNHIFEPFLGNMKNSKVFFTKCNFTDSCRILQDPDSLSRMYNVKRNAIGHSRFPLLLVNTGVHNKASRFAHLMIKWMELNVGPEKTKLAIQKLLLDNSSGLMNNLISMLKILNGDPKFVLDFLTYLQSSVVLTHEEMNTTLALQGECFANDSYLSKHVKVAHDGKQTPQVSHQWSQWSLLVGLTEKQLEPARGARTPAKENLGPMEQERAKLIAETTKKKGKTQLNYEELLTIARDYYEQKTKRGKIYNELLSDNRVWK